MQDGRKGRMMPAIQVQDQEQFLHALDQVGFLSTPLDGFPPATRAVLQVDLYFEQGPLVVHCKGNARFSGQALQTEQDLQDSLLPFQMRGMWIDPEAVNFDLGECICLLGQHLEKKTPEQLDRAAE